ncbi:hypothetical protein DIURU_003786 [Diutina rugosa]|uniref:Uncharacterized protein n=1 Tax=Diutina rugosa TaxID=5481 RepID=A0A642UJU1_DIURU|nr:uncharacterized protein DIURU_003786 [Diutina rugosa]KAA8900363.1 hypothetical protein DIURU_003786 [Diutina rugosa]
MLYGDVFSYECLSPSSAPLAGTDFYHTESDYFRDYYRDYYRDYFRDFHHFNDSTYATDAADTTNSDDDDVVASFYRQLDRTVDALGDTVIQLHDILHNPVNNCRYASDTTDIGNADADDDDDEASDDPDYVYGDP